MKICYSCLDDDLHGCHSPWSCSCVWNKIPWQLVSSYLNVPGSPTMEEIMEAVRWFHHLGNTSFVPPFGPSIRLGRSPDWVTSASGILFRCMLFSCQLSLLDGGGWGEHPSVLTDTSRVGPGKHRTRSLQEWVSWQIVPQNFSPEMYTVRQLCLSLLHRHCYPSSLSGFSWINPIFIVKWIDPLRLWKAKRTGNSTLYVVPNIQHFF